MKYLSIFSGIGGFERGIQNATNNNWECVGFSEIDKYAIQIYQKHFPTHKNWGNATQINTDKLPDFDFLCGGVPCQSWSIAGKRKGFEDIRGTMWFEVFRIVKGKKPSYILLENVKGLLSHNGGNSFERLCEMICEIGYVIDFTVVNSKYFGVPQNRERVFILAIKGDLLPKGKII